ncbi:histidine kinase [Chloroflexota bacterium]
MAIGKIMEASIGQKPRFGIRAKILVSFLAVSLIAVGIISVFAIRNMGIVGNTARQNLINLGESAVAESITALEDSGRKIIQLRANVVARDVKSFIEQHPDLELADLKDNKDLKKIAVQTVGQTGSTMVFGSDGIIYIHDISKFAGVPVLVLATGIPELADILESSLYGEAAGYYEERDGMGDIRAKYIYSVPVEGTSLMVAATTFIDEFSRPAEKTESVITAGVIDTTQYVENQMDAAQLTFLIIIVCMIIIIATLASFMARTITEPVTALTKGAEVIGRGDLDHQIKITTGDEMEQLATQFNAMTAALKESYSNLEQKVKDRTKQERQRAEQLRTINEISRKISSIINLDELLPYVTNLLRETFNYHNVNIFLFESQSGKLILKEICLSGYKGVIPLDVPLEMGDEGIVAWVSQTGEPLLANDVSQDPRYRFIEELSTTKSELAVAVRIGENILGVLDIESKEIDAFSEADLFTAQTLADQLAVAIDNARLYQATGQMAVMEERNRMAREIHDTLAQGFTGIILQLEAAEQALSDGSSEVYQHLNKAKSLGRGSLNEARRSVWDLRPKALEQLSLVEAMRQEVGRLAQTDNIKARFDVSHEVRELPLEVETAMLRICQESLANIRKHANATEVKVELAFNDSGVVLNIRDNGRGFQTKVKKNEKVKNAGFGLVSMQERARNLGGTFEVQTEKRKGTLIKIVIPTM